ncbi:MAG: MaoC family dehydratase N-terminal domain-containing protein, partial [Deltaproteobacteria bacterium]|nr:MaoC family dehydratase N-terminal domain-containing protein [Deltaproteobacteria bacterium]
MSGLDLNLIGKKSEPTVFNYTRKDTILYALGIGAQTNELSFIYENAPGGQKVFPSYCVISGSGGIPSLGDNIDQSKFLHGEQLIRLYGPLPPEGKIVRVGEVKNIYDKGKAAVIKYQVSGSTEEGKHLFDTEMTIFYRGAGGFGGDPGPKAEPLNPPEGQEPDFSVSYDIPKNQAALYRLNGDYNPLHLDPEFAKRGGFDTPILHGLCTYGHAVRAIYHSLCGGDPARFKEFKARFSDVVYPGETLTTKGWKDKGG